MVRAVLGAAGGEGGLTRYGESEGVGVRGEEAFEERGLAGARGAGDYNGAVFLRCWEGVSVEVSCSGIEIPVGAIVLCR